MHELGILSNIINSIEELMETENLTVVDTIVLEVGELSGVIPKYIKDCYPAAIYKTKLADTKLQMDVIEGIGECRECHEKFNVLANDLECPKCKSRNIEPLTGKQFMIKQIIAC